MINVTWLNTFCVLVEQQHFTVTASKLFMTQSGVSQQVKKLEQQLGTPLLVREGKSFSLTEAGKKLYQQGGELLRNIGELESQVRQDSPYEGEVKICSPGSVGLRLYPYLLSLQVQHPELSIDYKFAPNEDVVARLLNRSADIGLTTAVYNSEKLAFSAISEEALVLVTANDVETVSWRKLLELGVIAHPDGAHHCGLLLGENFPEFEHFSQFQQRGFSNQISLILEPVSLGLGFTVLPMHAVQAFHKQALIKVHSLPVAVKETLYLCHHKREIESARVKFIRSEIQRDLASLA